MKSFKKTVAVYGSSAIQQDSPSAVQAYRLGRLLAESGFIVCNGGYMGAMEACSRGAHEVGGEVIGVTCQLFTNRTPNPYLTKEIECKDLPERITTLMHLADAYVVLDGSIGTLAELFLAWNIVAMGGTNPIYVIGEKLKKGIYGLTEHTEIGDKHLSKLNFVNSIEEAVDFLKREL